jgi:hypothetical protein
VRECAILALCKYMCVSSSFCEKNLQLLFSLLSSRRREDHFEGSHRLRANIIIAVGDLAFRFPNLLEPWTKHIYRPLSVRHTALSFLYPLPSWRWVLEPSLTSLFPRAGQVNEGEAKRRHGPHSSGMCALVRRNAMSPPQWAFS